MTSFIKDEISRSIKVEILSGYSSLVSGRQKRDRTGFPQALLHSSSNRLLLPATVDTSQVIFEHPNMGSFGGMTSLNNWGDWSILTASFYDFTGHGKTKTSRLRSSWGRWCLRKPSPTWERRGWSQCPPSLPSGSTAWSEAYPLPSPLHPG